MFEQLADLVRQYSRDAIVNNPSIPNARNEEAIQHASGSILSGLQGLLSGGNLNGLLKMFSGQGNNNNAMNQQISGGFIQDMMHKFGLDQQQAGSMADKIVPNVLNEMVRKTNDPGDNSFDIQSIFNSLTGGQSSGINMQGLLNKVKAGKLDLDGDGDTDLQDLLSIVKGNAGGNLMEKVKNLLG
jgi:predicted lipid-binding transport protein (Tim44 family)